MYELRVQVVGNEMPWSRVECKSKVHSKNSLCHKMPVTNSLAEQYPKFILLAGTGSDLC